MLIPMTIRQDFWIRKSLTKKLILGLVLAAMPAIAQAGQITETHSYGSAAPGTPFSFSESLTFKGFDSSLGTLDSVEIILNSTAVLSPFATFSGPLAPTTPSISVSNVSGSGVFDAKTSFGLGTQTTLSTGQFSGTISPTNFGGLFYYGQTTFASSSVSGSTSNTITSGLASYIGSGVTFNVDLTAKTSGAGSTSSGPLTQISYGAGGSGYGTVEIVYHYTAPAAVPEPSTFALLGLGGLGFAVRRFRRRQVAV